jgi:hypothetical protein
VAHAGLVFPGLADCDRQGILLATESERVRGQLRALKAQTTIAAQLSAVFQPVASAGFTDSVEVAAEPRADTSNWATGQSVQKQAGSG